jgi:stearoyl-CoA desaturase (delta-9 desaturase)
MAPLPLGNLERTTPFSLSVLVYIAIHIGALGVFVVPGDLATGIAILVVTYYMRLIGLGAGYHRYFAHRAFKTSRPMQVVLAVLGLAAMQRGPLWWGETHRRHHRWADTPDDIHSPHYQGFWYSHWGWFFDPIFEETDFDGIRDFARYPELRWLDSGHASRFMMLLYGTGLWALFGLHGFVWGFCLSTVCTWHTVHWIQSMSHTFGGYRNFENADRSRNHLGLGIISLGEYHNNHHHRSGSAQQGYRWWEVDVTFWLLRGLGVLGLVWDVKDTLHEPTRIYAQREVAVPASGETVIEEVS